jgi:hypothetical protein
MDFKNILVEIQNRQLKTFCSVKDFRDKKLIQNLPTKHRGLYWIWSNLSFDNLQTITTRPDTMEVPISQLVKQRQDLQNINKIMVDGFRIVYNGIGGYEKETAAFGLRERINQELNCNDFRTGTLNLLNRFNDSNSIDNWAISYFDFDDHDNLEIVNQLSFNRNPYLDNAKTLEINWRIEFGTPILTRH